MDKVYTLTVCHSKFSAELAFRTEAYSTQEKADAAFKKLTSELIEAYQDDICSEVLENSPCCLLIRTDYGEFESSYVSVKTAELQVQ